MKGNVLHVRVLFWGKEARTHSAQKKKKKNLGQFSGGFHLLFDESTFFKLIWLSCISQKAFLWPQVQGCEHVPFCSDFMSSWRKTVNTARRFPSRGKKCETCFSETTTCHVAALHSGPFPAPVGVETALLCSPSLMDFSLSFWKSVQNGGSRAEVLSLKICQKTWHLLSMF